MDYQWYYPNSSGSGGSTEDKTDLQTDTITVTEDMLSAEFKTDRITPDVLAWQVDAVRVSEGIAEPVNVETNVTSSESTTLFRINWTKGFSGYINITTWRKK
ncbi:MAG: hypothetical protein SPL14_07645 [Candidatus Onthomorpha sp.]|nr:hypothetical protein [Bacteroidales bacterium]MCI7407382.1 hypothetical protein [Bacteroidales bacterium]MDD7484554.1 hypothetical protein [Bacteroidales bacterium]MDY5699284.1 hypothetical protein [Candidatus Onthomorpha sp.]